MPDNADIPTDKRMDLAGRIASGSAPETEPMPTIASTADPASTSPGAGLPEQPARVWRPSRRTLLLAGLGVAATAVAVPVGIKLTFPPKPSTNQKPRVIEEPAIDVLPKTISGNVAVTLPIGSDTTIGAVAFSPDGKILASAETGGSVALWDTATHAKIATITPNTYVGSAFVAFSPDGRTLATPDSNAANKVTGWVPASKGDGTVTLWDLATRTVTAALRVPHSVASVAFSPDGKTLATGNYSGAIQLWDLATRTSTATLDTNSYAVMTSLAFSPDGKTLATGLNGHDELGDPSGALLWDLATQKTTATLVANTNNTHIVDSVAFSPDGKTLATSSFNDGTLLWDLATRTSTTILNRGSFVTFSPDGKTLATSGEPYGGCSLWDIATRTNTLRANEATDVRSVAFSPDGKTLLAGGRGLSLWPIN